MKPRVVFCAFVLVALLAMTAPAADVNGKWVADVFNRLGGSQETSFNLKMDGTRVTGTVAIGGAGGFRTAPREIVEGNVNGSEITFAVIDKVRDLELKTVYKGKVDGNEIRFEAQMLMPPGGLGGFIPGPPTEFTAKKVQ
jgi:hypothetical protein